MDDVRDRLAEGRRATEAQLGDVVRGFDAIVAAAREDPPDDEHDPDGATVGFERAQAAALVEMLRERLREFDRALVRLDAGSYGRCETCGSAISDDRLRVLPTATECRSCANESGRDRRR